MADKKLTQAQIKEQAKIQVLEILQDKIEEHEMVQTADFKFCVLVTVGEQEVWVELALTSKQFTETATASVFDAFEASEEWQAEKTAKEKEKLAKEKAKADKLAKAKAKSKKASE